MRLPFVLRGTYETELNKAIDIITEKNRVIATSKDEIKAQRKIKEVLRKRNEDLKYQNTMLHEDVDFLQDKINSLEDYINKLENVFNKKTDIACNLNSKLVEMEDKCKRLEESNQMLLDMFNDANRKNWCNNESSRQLKLLAEDILESDKINKAYLASYIANISMYVGGGFPGKLKLKNEYQELIEM